MGQGQAGQASAHTDAGEVPLSARELSRELSKEREGPVWKPEQRVNMAKLGASKLISIMDKRSDDSWIFTGRAAVCRVQSDSIYGAAIALPQIARSCEWPGTFCALVFRTYFFCILNFLLQAFLLSMIGEEFNMWFLFAGRMHLCNFGKFIEDCPAGSNCVGPAGTTYSYPRLYGFDIWSTRSFVEQSLRAIGGDTTMVDPGEYGLENFYCRTACIGLFLLSTFTDFIDSVENCKTLAMTPTRAESWITMAVPDWASKADVKTFHGHTELELIRFQVAGMPLHWKILNAVLIILPKFLLWLGLVRSGVHYLMETAGIMDVIVNAMALSFILNVDEMILNRLTSRLAQHIMQNMRDLEEEEEEAEDNKLLQLYEQEEINMSCFRLLYKLVPVQLILLVLTTFFFMADYYLSHCVQTDDGSSVSKAMYLPAQVRGNLLRFMFGIEAPQEAEAFWTMPKTS